MGAESWAASFLAAAPPVQLLFLLLVGLRLGRKRRGEKKATPFSGLLCPGLSL
ncbi:hypothetical protein I79_010464 [Cricetulus griseus]|uniref:Uncharacterized protein n=1 Tax=Cricetulus griseus TaxID=10029 RepID=G3HIJ3_CRIGR|nr:hypothetical protein I79_010464 [Cricetulus griseus]